MRIVVTGASGFVGGHLCRALTAASRDVLGVARKPVTGFAAEQVDDYRQSPTGDVLVHLAEPADRGSVSASGDLHVREAVDVLQCLVERGYGHVVYASSAAVYGDEALASRRVGDRTGGDDPYVHGKLACEALVAKVGGASVRLANVYGAGMNRNNVASTILRQIPGVGPLRIRDGAPVRDFLWIGDAAAGLAALAEQRKAGVFNLGSGRGVSIRDLARMALTAAGEADRHCEETQPSGRTSHLVLDVAATEAAIGWQARVAVEEGIARLVADSCPVEQGAGR